jgi:hypothetical protein
MDEAMRDAHVAYEMSRLTGGGLTESVNDEVESLFAWMATAPLGDVVDTEAVVTAVVRAVREIPDAEAPGASQEVTSALRAALADSPETVGDMVSEDDAARWATTLASMDEARDQMLTQLTSSRAYSRLVAHVVYYGVKNYLLSENALAKRIPGASSLVRLGQRSLTAAAPGLEKNVDRQLVAFVDASIADTVRESRRFIDRMLSEADVEQAARQGWAAVADRPVAAAADILGENDAEVLGDLVWQQWTSLRLTPLVESMVEAVVRGYLDENADRPVADVLAELGVDAEWVTGWLGPLIESTMAQPQVSDYVEQRVRERLTAFYDQYDG